MKFKNFPKVMLFTALASLSVVACNKTNDNDTPETQVPMEQPATPPVDTVTHLDTAAAAGDTAVLIDNTQLKQGPGTTTTTTTTTTTSGAKSGTTTKPGTKKTTTTTKKTTTTTTSTKKGTDEEKVSNRNGSGSSTNGADDAKTRKRD